MLVLDRTLDLAVVRKRDDLAAAVEEKSLARVRELFLREEIRDFAHGEVGAENALARAVKLARERDADLLTGSEDVGVAAMHLVVIMRQPVPLTHTRVIGGFRRGALLD